MGVTKNFSKDCLGFCDTQELVEVVMVANREAVKNKGMQRAFGGNILRSYIKYEIPSKKFRVFIF